MSLVMKPSLIKLCIMIMNIFDSSTMSGIFQIIFLCYEYFIFGGFYLCKNMGNHYLGVSKSFLQQDKWPPFQVTWHELRTWQILVTILISSQGCSFSQNQLLLRIFEKTQNKYWTSTYLDPAQRKYLVIYSLGLRLDFSPISAVLVHLFLKKRFI